MADAHEARVGAEAIELAFRVGREEIDPAHDAADDVVFVFIFISEPKQILRLLQALPGLHRDRAVEAVRFQKRLQINRSEISTDHVHALGVPNPAVLLRTVDPEVLVSVYAHGGHIIRLHRL